MRLHVRGSSSAVEYAKKSFAMDPVDTITDFAQAVTTKIPFLGVYVRVQWAEAPLGTACQQALQCHASHTPAFHRMHGTAIHTTFGTANWCLLLHALARRFMLG